MGTSDFACRCLVSLERVNLTPDWIITRPDSESGRSRRPSMPPVKKWARERGLEVWQPKNINNPANAAKLAEFSPDLLIVVAYGKILSKNILDIPTLGSINVHASLLPELRGAAPIEWAIMLGHAKTGITTMFMDEGLDTGDIILQKSIEIQPDENAGQLRERLAEIAEELLPKTVMLAIDGKAPRIPQPRECHDFAPTLDSRLERIDWNWPALRIANQIRALAPKPGCYTMYGGKRLKIFRASAVQGSASPGNAVLAGKRLTIGTGEGLLEVFQVQPEGKKILAAQDFINGYRIQGGEQFL